MGDVKSVYLIQFLGEHGRKIGHGEFHDKEDGPCRKGRGLLDYLRIKKNLRTSFQRWKFIRVYM